MSIPISVRHGWLEALPWVRKLKKPTACDGIKWGKVALSDLYPRGGKPARGIQDRAKCKKNAWWHYKALETSDAFHREGNYCFYHAAALLYDNEQERWERYVKAHPEKFPQHPGFD